MNHKTFGNMIHPNAPARAHTIIKYVSRILAIFDQFIVQFETLLKFEYFEGFKARLTSTSSLSK